MLLEKETINELMRLREKFGELKREIAKYKKIEEDLGVDLIALFKALKNGIWYNDDGEIKKMYISDIENLICWNDMEISIFEGVVYHFNWRDSLYVNEEKYVKDYKSHPLYDKAFNTAFYNCRSVDMEDYGDTWALTKEELL